MARHGTNQANNAQQVSVVSKKLKQIGARLEPLIAEEPAFVEERQDTDASSPRKFTVRAITEKFERQLADRQEVRRQPMACGTRVAERKKLLQQALLSPAEDVSHSKAVNQAAHKSDAVPEKKTLLKSKRGKTIAANRRKQALRVADKMKVFETSKSTGATMAHGDTTVISAPEEQMASVLAAVPSSKQLHGGVSTTASAVEVSTLAYSTFSDETLILRDRTEELGRWQEPDSRQMLAPYHHENNDVPCPDSTSWPNNNFQSALDDIVANFEKESGASPSEGAATSRIAAVDSREVLATSSSKKILDTEASNANHAMVSMLTGFDTDVRSKESATSHDTVRSKSNVLESGMWRLDDTTVPFDESVEATRVANEKTSAESSPSFMLPNASLFSTVEQFEEREKIDNQYDGLLNDDRTVSPKVQLLATNTDHHKQLKLAPDESDDAHVNPDLHELDAMFNVQEQVYERDTTSYEVSFGDPWKESNWPSEPNQEMSLFTTNDQFNYDTEEGREDNLNSAFHVVSTTEARDEAANSNAASTLIGPSRRYVVSAEEDTPSIRGILKNRMDPLTPATQPQVSPGSSASWYSSATSTAASEVSQQLSPLHNSRLAVPILPQSNRFSIGACVNAHLLENPPKDSSDGSSQPSGLNPQMGESLLPVSLWPQRLQGRDSPNSSFASYEMRNQTVSPSSVDPQFSKSHQDQRQDSDAIAQAVTTMAKTASTVVLVLVEAADKVVVAPLISVLNCVDRSESFLCQGPANWGAACGQTSTRERKSRRKKLRSRSRSRKFKA